jgi:hypothetical protein
MAYVCFGIRLTLVMCLMLDIKLTLYQNFIYMVSYNRENIFQSYIIQQRQASNIKLVRAHIPGEKEKTHEWLNLESKCMRECGM